MKTILHLCMTTLAAYAFVPSATAQNSVPGSRPGESSPKPGVPAADTTPGDKKHADREGKPGHDAAMMPANETEFVTTTAKKGMAEVKAAQLGVEKAEDPKVKELAQMLVTDHTAANAQLKTVAGELSIELSDDRDEKTQQKYKELSALSGKEFDQAFLAHMHKCHNKSIAFMEAGRKVSKSDGVIAFIEKTLPVIKGHTKMIGELHVATPDEGATAKPDTAPRGSQPQAGTERR